MGPINDPRIDINQQVATFLDAMEAARTEGGNKIRKTGSNNTGAGALFQLLQQHGTKN